MNQKSINKILCGRSARERKKLLSYILYTQNENIDYLRDRATYKEDPLPLWSKDIDKCLIPLVGLQKAPNDNARHRLYLSISESVTVTLYEFLCRRRYEEAITASTYYSVRASHYFYHSNLKFPADFRERITLISARVLLFYMSSSSKIERKLFYNWLIENVDRNTEIISAATDLLWDLFISYKSFAEEFFDEISKVLGAYSNESSRFWIYEHRRALQLFLDLSVLLEKDPEFSLYFMKAYDLISPSFFFEPGKR